MSSTRLLVLGVVRIFQPVHGYDVRRELLSWSANEWANVAPGSIYNALKSMTRDGLLEVVGTNAIGGRPERTTYQLTHEGDKEFQNLVRRGLWLVEEPLDPLLPSLAFMWTTRRPELIAALQHRIAVIEGKLKSVAFAIEQQNDPYSRDQVREMLTLSSARAAAEIPWAKALIGKLERGEYTFADERTPAEVKQRAAALQRSTAAARTPKPAGPRRAARKKPRARRA